jgi:hypothetical protein
MVSMDSKHATVAVRYYDPDADGDGKLSGNISQEHPGPRI